jgi:hypothetical protein
MITEPIIQIQEEEVELFPILTPVEDEWDNIHGDIFHF